MNIKLYAHQEQLLKLNPKKWLLAHETGTGKSITAIFLAKKNTDNALVICPKSIKEQWLNYIDKYCNSKWLVLTKEEFKKKVKSIGKYDCVIWDEAHYASGMKSSIHKTTMWYVRTYKPQCVYLLTATPFLSTPWNIYALASILGRNWNYMRYKQKFFYEVKFGARTVPVIKKGIEQDIAELVDKLGNTIKLEDCVDMPEQIFKTEYFELTAEQRRAIAEIDDVMPIVKWTKIHQICGGTLKGDGYIEDKFFKSNKLNRLLELCQEHKKIVVVCRYNNEIKNIKSQIQIRKNPPPVFEITGSTKNKQEVIEQADKSDKAIVIANAACSEGYELPSFPIMIFYSYDFSLKNYIQMKGRIQRINKIKRNVYISLIVKDTIDENVKKCIDRKQDFDCAIYDKTI